MTAMSKTDKTRPYYIKKAEVENDNPYGIRREGYLCWRGELRGCPRGRRCFLCHGWVEVEKQRAKRQAKEATRNWRKEYE